MMGGGTYCSWCASRRLWHWRSFFSVHNLLNHLMDFDQTCIYTLLGEGNEFSRFGDLHLIFKVSGTLKCLKYGFCALSSELVFGF